MEAKETERDLIPACLDRNLHYVAHASVPPLNVIAISTEASPQSYSGQGFPKTDSSICFLRSMEFEGAIEINASLLQ